MNVFAVMACLAAQSVFTGLWHALDTLEHPLSEDTDRFRATRELTTLMLLSVGATAMVQLGAQWSLHWSVALALVPVAYLVAETLPRNLGRHYAEAVGPVAAQLWQLWSLALGPLAWPAARWSALIGPDPSTASREELVRLLEDEAPGDDIDPDERRLIQRVLAIGETAIEDAMTPLVDVVAVPETAAVRDAAASAMRNGLSRLPVYRDRIDNIIGLVDHRDLLFATDADAPIGGLMHEVDFVPETKLVDDLLREMQSGHRHFAVVVDEYGGSVGIVTREDLLEEIVGEIRDERDTDEPGIRRLGPRTWRVPARTEIEELSEVVGWALPEGEFETIAGLILSSLGRIPDTGEAVVVGDLEVLIELANERAIQMVQLTLPEKHDDDD